MNEEWHFACAKCESSVPTRVGQTCEVCHRDFCHVCVSDHTCKKSDIERHKALQKKYPGLYGAH